MPILPKETDLFPDDLLANETHQKSSESQWMVLYTLARREKDVMRRLRALAVSFYGPLVKRRSRSPQGRVRVSFVPLFPGYVFLFGTPEDRQLAWSTHGISRVLPVVDTYGFTRDLRYIHQLVASDVPLTPEARLQPGARVRVRSGSLMGIEGVVVQRRGKDRLVVAIELLSQGASVLIDDFQLEKL